MHKLQNVWRGAERAENSPDKHTFTPQRRQRVQFIYSFYKYSQNIPQENKTFPGVCKPIDNKWAGHQALFCLLNRKELLMVLVHSIRLDFCPFCTGTASCQRLVRITTSHLAASRPPFCFSAVFAFILYEGYQNH